MKKIKKHIVLFAVMMFMVLNMISAFALTTAEAQTYIDSHSNFTLVEGSHYSTTLVNASDFPINYKGQLVYLNDTGKDFITSAINAENQAQANSDAIASQIGDIDVGLGELTPDMDWAATTLQPAVPAIRFVLGLMVTVITIGMTLLCAADIAYIVFPIFRGKCEDMKQKGGPMVDKNRSNKSGQTKLKFISDEAEYAINAAETVQTGKNPLVIYFGKRAVSYIVLAIVLFILLTGNITILTDIAVKAASGVLKLIQSMGNL